MAVSNDSVKTLQYSLEWAQSTRNRHGLIGSNACLTTGAGQYTRHIAVIQYAPVCDRADRHALRKKSYFDHSFSGTPLNLSRLT
jgi:hypothetical protein|tara:strand:+ start:361 stop:612 length:252 start_codon:yes stop_codon:yes gene_type:complete